METLDLTPESRRSRSRSLSSPRVYRSSHKKRSRSRSPRRHSPYRDSRGSETPPHSAVSRRYYSIGQRDHHGGGGGYQRGGSRGSFRGRGSFRERPRVESYSQGYSNAKHSSHHSHDNYDRNYKKKSQDGRENAEPCRCLGIFGMSLNTTEDDLFKIFKEFGYIDSIRVVRDRESNRSRGFGFVYFNKTTAAEKAKYQLEDAVVDGMKVRVDYSVTNGSSNYEAKGSPRRQRRHSDDRR